MEEGSVCGRSTSSVAFLMNTRQDSTLSPIGTRRQWIAQSRSSALTNFVSELTTIMSDTTRDWAACEIRISKACFSMKSWRGSTLSSLRTQET